MGDLYSPPLRGRKTWSPKNVYIIFYQVYLKNISIQGRGTLFLGPKPKFREILAIKMTWLSSLTVQWSQWSQLSQTQLSHSNQCNVLVEFKAEICLKGFFVHYQASLYWLQQIPRQNKKNTVETPLTVTSPQWWPATSQQWPLFFQNRQSIHRLLFNPLYNGNRAVSPTAKINLSTTANPRWLILGVRTKKAVKLAGDLKKR